MKERDPARRSNESKALIVALLIIAILLVLFLAIDLPLGTSSTVSDGGDATSASDAVEQPVPMTE